MAETIIHRWGARFVKPPETVAREHFFAVVAVFDDPAGSADTSEREVALQAIEARGDPGVLARMGIGSLSLDLKTAEHGDVSVIVPVDKEARSVLQPPPLKIGRFKPDRRGRLDAQGQIARPPVSFEGWRLDVQVIKRARRIGRG